MYCSTTAIQESVAFSSDTVTGLRLQHPQLAAVGSATVVAVAPSRGGFGSPRKVNGFARGSPTRGAVERSETERLYRAAPFLYISPGCGSQRLLRPLVRASHPAGRGPSFASLFPPLAAVGSAAKQNPPAQQAPASCTGGNIKWSSSGFRPPPAWPDSSGPLRRPV